jgi:hypothetical protein
MVLLVIYEVARSLDCLGRRLPAAVFLFGDVIQRYVLARVICNDLPSQVRTCLAQCVWLGMPKDHNPLGVKGYDKIDAVTLKSDEPSWRSVLDRHVGLKRLSEVRGVFLC